MGWTIFGFAYMSLFGFWTYLLYKDEMKKINKHYTRPTYHGSSIEPVKEEEHKNENKEKQKIKIT